jgi:hypothetical protein
MSVTIQFSSSLLKQTDRQTDPFVRRFVPSISWDLARVLHTVLGRIPPLLEVWNTNYIPEIRWWRWRTAAAASLETWHRNRNRTTKVNNETCPRLLLLLFLNCNISPISPTTTFRSTTLMLVADRLDGNNNLRKPTTISYPLSPKNKK